MPSDAVHGRSNAKRNTLTIATRSAAAHTGHGCPKTSRYCGLNRRAIARDSTGRPPRASRTTEQPRASDLLPPRETTPVVLAQNDPWCHTSRERVSSGGGTPVPPPDLIIRAPESASACYVAY